MDTKAIGAILGPRYELVAADGARALNELGLPANAAVLDVGTGMGNFAIFLASQGYQVVTGEPSTDTTQYAGRDWAANAKAVGLLDRIRFEDFNAGTMPFPSASFDAVFFFGVLHHIDEQARRDVLREALRVAKPDGAVVFFEPQPHMLEIVRGDDPTHPDAANPSEYLPSEMPVRERHFQAAVMDIYIFKHATRTG